MDKNSWIRPWVLTIDTLEKVILGKQRMRAWGKMKNKQPLIKGDNP